jgi:hypothetical protein
MGPAGLYRPLHRDYAPYEPVYSKHHIPITYRNNSIFRIGTRWHDLCIAKRHNDFYVPHTTFDDVANQAAAAQNEE